MRGIFHLFLIISGIIFLLLGFLGLFLPIVPGILLILLGLIVLGGRSKIHDLIIKKFPEPVRKYFEQAEKNLNPVLILILTVFSLFSIGLFLYYLLQFKN